MSARSEKPKLLELSSASWSFHSNSCACIRNDSKIYFIGAMDSDPEKSLISRPSKATSLAWSPSSDSLAMGWSDGNVGIWANDQVFYSNSSKNDEIAMIAWHPTKPRIVSASKTGELCFWSVQKKQVTLEAAKKTDYQFIRLIFTPEEKSTIFAMTDEGELFKFVLNDGDLILITSLPRPINYISLSYDGKTIRSVSGDNVLTIYSTIPNSKKISQWKLESGESMLFAEINDNTLCYSVNDMIHISSLDGTNEINLKPKEGDQIVGLMYYHDCNELACMTEAGRVLLWHMDPEKRTFSLIRSLESTYSTKKAIWSPFMKNALSVSADKSFSMCQIPLIRCVVSKDITAIQTDTKSIALTGAFRKRFDFSIEKISASASNLLVVSKSHAYLMNMGYASLTSLSDFAVTSTCVEILADTVYSVNKNKLEIHNKQGEIRATIELSTNSPITQTCINGRFLCLLSETMTVFLFDVSKRTPVLLSTSQIDVPEDLHRVRSISISRGGYCLSISYDVMENGQWVRSPQVFLHSPKMQKTVPWKPEGGSPIAHLWDTISERIFCVQTSSLICPAFVTNELEVIPMKNRPTLTDGIMFKVESPRVFSCITGTKIQISADNAVSSYLIPQIIEIDGLDGQTRRLLINLFYSIASGDRLGAEGIVQSIKEESIARPAIRFCSSIGEHDFAEMFSKLLTEQTEEKTIDKLSFLDNLTTASYDDAALLCTPSDKLTIRAASYLRGTIAENNGNLPEATKLYSASGPNGAEILRMALHHGDLSIIFRAANDGNSDPQLHLWLGRYYEYKQQFDTALTHYDLCGEIRESLRLLCIMKRWQDAAKRVADTGVRGSICALARLISKKIPSITDEEEKETAKKEVLSLFKRAKQTSAAFQFAFENDMKSDILSLSLGAPPALLARAAKKYEDNDELRIAVLLWNRAGRVNKAITLCLKNELLGALEEISDSITDSSDHSVLESCAKFFAEKENWARCAYFYALGHNFTAAGQVADAHEVKLTNQILESLSTVQDENESRQIAGLCEQQGAFQVAAKIWVRLGDHISAIRNIIKDDDPEKVIRFANRLKRKDAFIIAADYLSGKSPRESEPLFNTIMQFYQRAGSYDKISQFLEKSAQTEIDDYQDYNHALDLLRRAHQTMAKTEMTREREALVMSQLQKIRWIEMYLESSACVQTDPMRMQCICNELLQTHGVDSCLRLEDVYMLLVQYFAGQGNYIQAHRILENMRMNGVDIKWFMEEDQLKRIYRSAGQEYEDLPEEEKQQIDDIPDDVVEPVEDDF